MSQYLVGVVPGSGGVGTVTSITAGTGITLTPSPITTTGSVALTIPVVIANGGTNATTYGTVDGTIYYNGTRLVTTVTGTAGQVLTSNGVGVAPTYQAAGGGGITTIDGDSGSVTGSTVTITGGTSGAVFTGAGSTLTESFNFISLPTTTSTNGQILINSVPVLHTFDQGIWVGDAGNFTIGGTSTLNLGIGELALSSLTTFSQFNCAIGNNSLGALTSNATSNIALGYGSSLNLLHGTGCIAIGVSSGTAWTGSESYNIAIANTGTVSTSNQLNIGSGTGSGAKQLNSAFISGIQTIPVSGSTVIVNSSDQLGVNGIAKNTGQPALLAWATTATNVTGDSTDYTILFDNIVFDQDSNFNTGTGVFTAPVTGRYYFSVQIAVANMNISMTAAYFQVSCTSRAFLFYNCNPYAISNSGSAGLVGSSFVDMAATDTLHVHIAIAGSTKTVTLVGNSSGDIRTSLSVYLVC